MAVVVVAAAEGARGLWRDITSFMILDLVAPLLVRRRSSCCCCGRFNRYNKGGGEEELTGSRWCLQAGVARTNRGQTVAALALCRELVTRCCRGVKSCRLWGRCCRA